MRTNKILTGPMGLWMMKMVIFPREPFLLLFFFYFNFRSAKINWNLKKQKYTQIDSTQSLCSVVRSAFLCGCTIDTFIYEYMYCWRKVVFAADSLGNKTRANWNLYSIDDRSVDVSEFCGNETIFLIFLDIFLVWLGSVRLLFLLHLVKIHKTGSESAEPKGNLNIYHCIFLCFFFGCESLAEWVRKRMIKNKAK